MQPGECLLLPAGLRMSVSFLPSQNERGETVVQVLVVGGAGVVC